MNISLISGSVHVSPGCNTEEQPYVNHGPSLARSYSFSACGNSRGGSQKPWPSGPNPTCDDLTGWGFTTTETRGKGVEGTRTWLQDLYFLSPGWIGDRGNDDTEKEEVPPTGSYPPVSLRPPVLSGHGGSETFVGLG